MKQLLVFIQTYWFIISVFLLVVLAVFLRFYNYENRWGLAYDQARDVIVATEALHTHKIPLIGPFTSTGQFVYGPQWYWILMLFVAIYPYSVLTPWVVQTLLYTGAVALMILIGKEIYNKKFGLLLGLLTAVSTSQIAQSTNLTYPSMVGILSLLTVYIFIKFIKTDRVLFAFLLGFCITTSINVHFQAIGLLMLIPIGLFFSKRSKTILLSLLAGFLIPLLPLIIFDLQTNFFETKGILDYYLYGQNNIYTPNRWLTYAGVLWPTIWGKIVGGYAFLGYVSIVFLTAITIFSLIKRKISKIILSLIISFLLMFTMLRYYKGERFESYFVFLHPFVLILTGWTIFQLFSLYKISRIIGICLLFSLIAGSVHSSFKEIVTATNHTKIRAEGWSNLLLKTYPQENFLLHDYQFRSPGNSLPLVLFLEKRTYK